MAARLRGIADRRQPELRVKTFANFRSTTNPMYSFEQNNQSFNIFLPLGINFVSDELAGGGSVPRQL
jgi:beta-xylosidase